MSVIFLCYFRYYFRYFGSFRFFRCCSWPVTYFSAVCFCLCGGYFRYFCYIRYFRYYFRYFFLLVFPLFFPLFPLLFLLFPLLFPLFWFFLLFPLLFLTCHLIFCRMFQSFGGYFRSSSDCLFFGRPVKLCVGFFPLFFNLSFSFQHKCKLYITLKHCYIRAI